MEREYVNKRQYERINIDINCLVYINSTENVGYIVNISENGLGLTVKMKDLKEEIHIGDSISVINAEFKKVNNFKAKVIHLQNVDDVVYIGARIINDSDVKSYILMKKGEHFLNTFMN